MKIIPLSEGAFTVDITKKFVPFKKDKDDLQERSLGSILVEIQPFAVITANDVIVIDTGLGFNMPDGTLQIHQNLLNNGIGPLEVTKVLLSHLHKDHAGGIYKTDDLLKQKFLSFPNATYYVHKDEMAFALKKGAPSYHITDFEGLQNSDQVIFLEGDSGKIDGYITYKLTGAHSPCHQVFWIEEEGQKIFFGGDVAPQLQQMKNKFIAKYDFDGRKCMELRQQWWEQGAEEKWTFLFYHDIKTPVFGF
ncbi:MAG: MBL fold metallo-hydrolase [Chitinophagaceae bacterium]|nr:MBL fold metallo-hydrolase [Chitinophagaceae bacterium]